MTITKNSNPEKTLKGLMIYLSEAERLMLKEDLARANTHRKKELSMSEFLRKRLFSVNVREVEPSVIPNYDKLIQDAVQAALEAANPHPGLLTGDTAKIVNLIDENMIEKYNLTQASIEQTRRDILTLRDELLAALTRD